jgi:hypothetical protein
MKSFVLSLGLVFAFCSSVVAQTRSQAELMESDAESARNQCHQPESDADTNKSNAATYRALGVSQRATLKLALIEYNMTVHGQSEAVATTNAETHCNIGNTHFGFNAAESDKATADADYDIAQGAYDDGAAYLVTGADFFSDTNWPAAYGEFENALECFEDALPKFTSAKNKYSSAYDNYVLAYNFWCGQMP